MVPAAPTVTVDEKVLLFVETSNPLGGVTRMPSAMLVPETEKEVEVDAVPYVVLSAAGVPEEEIVAVAAEVACVKVLELALVPPAFTARTRT